MTIFIQKALAVALTAISMSISLASCSSTWYSDDGEPLTKEERRELIREVCTEIAEAAREARNIDTDSVNNIVVVNHSDLDADIDRVNSIISRYANDRDIEDDIRESIIPIIAILCIFLGLPLCVVLIVWLCLRYNTNRRREQARIAMMNLERGMPTPPASMPTPPATPHRRYNRLQSGITNIMWGIGIAIALALMGADLFAIACGIIPVLIGCGKLITYYLEEHDSNKE